MKIIKHPATWFYLMSALAIAVTAIIASGDASWVIVTIWATVSALWSAVATADLMRVRDR